jgi:large subunit ribosomal protein L28
MGAGGRVGHRLAAALVWWAETGWVRWWGPAGVLAGARLNVYAHPDRHEELPTLAAVCDVCGKGPGFGMSVSHSHRRTHRRWNPNIQTVRASLNGARKRLNVCASCLKAGKVTRG